MSTTSIEQTLYFDATPEQLYHLLMDQEKHAAFTGAEVIMSPEVGGIFDVFDGYCHGRNIELIEGKKIVQAWHFAEDGWPDDHFSVCTFLFEPVGNQTKLTFLQTDVPDHKAEALAEGWRQFYWEPMAAHLRE